MHIFNGLVTSASALILFLSTPLVAPSVIKNYSVPDPAHCPFSEFFSPQFATLPFEFWIEVVPSQPLGFPFDFREKNPVRIERDYSPPIVLDGGEYFDGEYDRPIVTRATATLARDLFLLKDNALFDSDGQVAQLWPDTLYPDYGYDGYQPLVFRPNYFFRGPFDSLEFTVVKVCNELNLEYDLELVGKRRFLNVTGRMFCRVSSSSFFSNPPFIPQCDC